jgi:NAD+ diphosphatase|tara:strand:- start:129477 stop:130304 length:828 start_codon:yes stop_codon:yes gene_type:complete
MTDFKISLDYLPAPESHHAVGSFYFFEDGHLVILGSNSELYSEVSDLQLVQPNQIGSPIYIGSHSDNIYFAQQLETGTAERQGLELVHLRTIAEEDELSFAIMGRALQLINWRQSYRFCGHCGTKTELLTTVHAMHCDNCGRSFYPKIMPCVMALVTRGDECLLATHNGRASSRYTALAGFIEAGESAEHAVYREVLEEVGIKTGKLTYFSSQAWPFPGQLMLAYYAEYLDGEINPDEEEIADAQWFKLSELPEIPPNYTISGKLIRALAEAKKA